MLSRKSIFLLRILTLLFTLALCFPWVAMAQFVEQRLIPLSDPAATHPSRDFVVYGRACKGHPHEPPTNPNVSCDGYVGGGAYDAGILPYVMYLQIPNSQQPERIDIGQPELERMPDLETFFEFGGTLELLTTDLTLHRYDLVISELMWGVDKGLRDTAGQITIENPHHNPEIPTDSGNPAIIAITVPQVRNQETQWIELYNTTNAEITAELYFLFTPFKSYPVRERDVVVVDGTTYRVLDTVDTLFTGLWRLPGKSGRRPTTAFVSAYRNINYEIVEDTSLTRSAQLTGIPFGSNPESWKETPDRGRRNTELIIVVEDEAIEILCVATPGAKHVTGGFVGRLDRAPVRSNIVVINEIRNDTSTDNIDWVELKNVSARAVQIEDWELSIVTGVGEDSDLVDLPKYELNPGEILILLNKDPWLTPIIGGINIDEEARRLTRLSRTYFVDTGLNLPNIGKFLLLLRSESDQNGKDNAIQDYAGNGFFIDTSFSVSTGFWPRVGQQVPTNIADFGEDSFASRSSAWARIRYQEDDGHHKDAWEEVGTQGGLGYDPDADPSTSPGTPGYENDALKVRPDDGNFRTLTTEHELTDGQISISEIMYDPGPNQNRVQWIELYNSSLTQAINIKGWVLEIHNIRDDKGSYVNENLTFNEAIILPNQTLLLVSKKASNSVLFNRVYDLNRQHRNELNLTGQDRLLLLNPDGFYLRLRTEPLLRFGNSTVVDEVGNIAGSRSNLIKLWELPDPHPDRRQSIARQYGTPFRPERGRYEANPGVPFDGTQVGGWRKASGSDVGETYYGDKKDLSTPGHRRGSPLPVELSSFRPVRMETGEVLIKWITESELNNAGFNILRSESRNSDFDVVNLKGIIPGHGTSSEQHIYSYTDTTAKPNIIYYYRIEDVSFDGVRQTIATVRLKGNVSASDKLTTTWSSLKTRN